MTEHRLMPVQVEVVKEVLVDRILALVLARYPGEAPEGVMEALEAKLELPACSGGPLDLRLRRIGYLTRQVEAEMFAPARAPLAGLAERLSRRLGEISAWAAAATSVSLELARAEPLTKPDPADQRAVTWTVPGPGGHVRHYVVSAAIAEALDGEPPDRRVLPAGVAEAGELKRCWTYGFLVRCCEEALPP